MRKLFVLAGIPVAAPVPVRPAETNCLAAVETVVGVGGATIISVTSSAAGTSVMVLVPDAEAPWKCRSDGAGNVQEIYYTAEG